MPTRDIVRILIVDDHAVVRLGFKLLLSQHAWCEVVAEAGNGELGYQLYRQHLPEVVIMDLTLPQVSGIATIARIKAFAPDARILVVSMHEDTVFVIQAMKAGASGYVSKGSAPEELVTAVEAVAQGKNYMSNTLAQRVVLYDVRGDSSPFAQLSAREFEIVSLATNGTDPREIATRLSISYKTVVNYLTQVKRKMNISSTAELTKLAIRHGIVALEGSN